MVILLALCGVGFIFNFGEMWYIDGCGKTRGPVLGRQTAVKNAGLRSVRSACGTTWSEVVDFAEQDTRISSGVDR